ncbi:MAG: phosphotransferase [Eubacteriales bacterium]|nr:phosphotransferase [Eubacteriales bacterium]
MMKISCEKENKDEIVLSVSGRIDTLSADEFGKTIRTFHEKEPDAKIILDYNKVEIVSCSALREMLSLIKQGINFSLNNVNADVYAILQLSGYLNYLEIERKKKNIKLEECELIGKGANAEVYRLNDEQVIKIFKRSPDIDKIIRERLLSKKALRAGVPSAISFELTEVNGDPGLIFELIKARSFAFQIGKDPEAIDKYIDDYVNAIKTIHAINAEKDFDYPLQAAGEIFSSYVDYLADYLDGQLIADLRKFIESLPESTMLLHGDIQPGNLMITKQEMLFIDMDSLAKGPEIFDLGYLYRTLILFWQVRSQDYFLRFNEECSWKLWNGFIQRYYAGENEETVKMKLKQIKIIGLVSICRKFLKRNEDEKTVNIFIEQLQNSVSDYLNEIEEKG